MLVEAHSSRSAADQLRQSWTASELGKAAQVLAPSKKTGRKPQKPYEKAVNRAARILLSSGALAGPTADLPAPAGAKLSALLGKIDQMTTALQGLRELLVVGS